MPVFPNKQGGHLQKGDGFIENEAASLVWVAPELRTATPFARLIVLPNSHFLGWAFCHDPFAAELSVSGDSLTPECCLSRLVQVQAFKVLSVQPLNSTMEPAFAEQPNPELYTTEQSTPATQAGNNVLNLSVVSKGQTAVDRFHPREHATQNGYTAIKLYLCEIGQVRQLTREEEIGLVARTKRGDRKARELLFKGNLRRVVKISREYENNGLPLLDLISEGNIGLIRAVERFEPTKGNKFSNFSALWIKQSIKRALANQSKTMSRQLDDGNQAGVVRFPVESTKSSRSRPANIRLLNVIRRMRF